MAPLLNPSTSSSARSPRLMRAISELVYSSPVLGFLMASKRRSILRASTSGVPAGPRPSAPVGSSSNQRPGGEAHRLGDRSELVHARVLDPALAEVAHVGAGEDAPRGPLQIHTAPSSAVLATVGLQETLELRGDVGQVPSSHF